MEKKNEYDEALLTVCSAFQVDLFEAGTPLEVNEKALQVLLAEAERRAWETLRSKVELIHAHVETHLGEACIDEKKETCINGIRLNMEKIMKEIDAKLNISVPRYGKEE